MKISSEQLSPLRQCGLVSIIAAAYAVFGYLALLLAIPPGYATAIYPPAGIALGATLIYGYRYSAGAFLGSLMVNAVLTAQNGELTAASFLTCSTIAAGATLQAIVAAWLIRQLIGLPNPLTDAKSITGFFLLAGPLACTISATCGIGALYTSGAITPDDALYSWWTWWVGDSIGVLVATPIFMSLFAEPREVWFPRRWTVTLPLALACLTTITIFINVSNWENERIALEFREPTEQVADAIDTRLKTNLTILHSLNRFFVSSNHVDPGEFKLFAEDTVKANPGMLALEWIQHVPASERETFESTMRAYGFTDFQITESDTSGALRTASQRDEYFPVTYVVPLDRNQRALGFDINSNPVRRNALALARATGQPTATAAISLVQDSGVSLGILLMDPVFSQNSETIAANRSVSQLRGYATAVLRIDQFLRSAIARTNTNLYSLKVVDIGDPATATLLFEFGTNPTHPQSYVHERTLEVAGRKWKLSFLATPQFAATHRSTQAWAILAGGLLFCGILGAVLMLETGNTARVQTLVKTRTQELAAATEEVRRKNRVLATISKIQSDFITTGDMQKISDHVLNDILELTESQYGFIGEALYTENDKPYLITHAVTGKAWDELARTIHDDNVRDGLPFESLDTLFAHVLRTRQPVFFNYTHRDPRADGLPTHHSPITAFLGLPFFHGSRLIGMVAIAKRSNGFDQSVAALLLPMLTMCATLFVASRNDATRLQAEQSVRDGESRLRAILDNAAEAIMTIEQDGIISTANPAAERLFGYDAERLVGQSIHVILRAPTDSTQPLALRNYLRSDASSSSNRSYEVVGIRSDNSTLPIELAVSNVQLDRAELYVAMLHDLTEHKKIERLKNDFISTVSHELRTPLTSIRGSLGLLADPRFETSKSQTRDLIKLAEKNVIRLITLVNDILDVEKIEAGKMPFETHPHSLVPLIDQAIQEILGFAEPHGISIIFTPTAEDTQKCWALVDGNRYIQVVVNLLSNAIKFSPPNTHVEVSAKCHNGECCVSVTDHGFGIPAEFREHIFTKFAQADASASRQNAGTGLGLSICRLIITKLGGRIDYCSEVGKGTTFFLYLPSVPAASLTDVAADQYAVTAD